MIGNTISTKKRNSKDLQIKNVVLVVTMSLDYPNDQSLNEIIKGYDKKSFSIRHLSIYGISKSQVTKRIKRYCCDYDIHVNKGDVIIYDNEVLDYIKESDHL